MEELTINGVNYKFNAIYSFLQKTRRSNGSIDCVVQIQVWREGRQIFWKEIKDTYAAEVIARHIMKIINKETK